MGMCYLSYLVKYQSLKVFFAIAEERKHLYWAKFAGLQRLNWFCNSYFMNFGDDVGDNFILVFKSSRSNAVDLCNFYYHLETVWRRQRQPTQVLLPGKFHGWRSLVGYHPWVCKKSDMTEQLHFFTLKILLFSRPFEPI